MDPGSAPSADSVEGEVAATPSTDPPTVSRAPVQASTVESQVLALAASGFIRPSVDDDAATVADDPVTVLQALREELRSGRSVDGDQDTVQLARLPVSFISESVIDPMTAYDHSPEATKWREETQARIDEIPPGPLPTGSIDRSQPTLARESDLGRSREVARAGAVPRSLPVATSNDDSEGDEDTFDRNVIWVGLVVGAISGFVAVLVFVAWFAGRV